MIDAVFLDSYQIEGLLRNMEADTRPRRGVAVLRSKPMKIQCRLLCGPIELGARLLSPLESSHRLVRIPKTTATLGTLQGLIGPLEDANRLHRRSGGSVRTPE